MNDLEMAGLIAGGFLAGVGFTVVGLYLYVTKVALPKLMPGLTIGAIGAISSLARKP